MKLKQNIVSNQFSFRGEARHYLKSRPWGSVALVLPPGELLSFDLLLVSSIYREISHDEKGYFCEGAGLARFESIERLVGSISEQIPPINRAVGFNVTESVAEGPEEKRKLVITGVITPFKIAQDEDGKYSISRGDDANVRKFSSIQYAIDDLLFEQFAKLYREESNKQLLLEFNRIAHEAIPTPLQNSLLALRRCLIVDTCALIEKGEAPEEACLRVSMPILVCINNMLRTISMNFEEHYVGSSSRLWIQSSEQEIRRSRDKLLPTNKWVIFGKVLLITVLGGAALAVIIGGLSLLVLFPLSTPLLMVSLLLVLPLVAFSSYCAICGIGVCLFAKTEKEQVIKAVFDATKNSLHSASGNLISCTFWQTPAVNSIDDSVLASDPRVPVTATMTS